MRIEFVLQFIAKSLTSLYFIVRPGGVDQSAKDCIIDNRKMMNITHNHVQDELFPRFSDLVSSQLNIISIFLLL